MLRAGHSAPAAARCKKSATALPAASVNVTKSRAGRVAGGFLPAARTQLNHTTMSRHCSCPAPRWPAVKAQAVAAAPAKKAKASDVNAVGLKDVPLRSLFPDEPKPLAPVRKENHILGFDPIKLAI